MFGSDGPGADSGVHGGGSGAPGGDSGGPEGLIRYALGALGAPYKDLTLSLIHISEPTRRTPISYAVFCLKKKNE